MSFFSFLCLEFIQMASQEVKLQCWTEAVTVCQLIRTLCTWTISEMATVRVKLK